MDWLVSMHVEVRNPLLCGSRALFTAQQTSDEESPVFETDLRNQIDAEMNKSLHTRQKLKTMILAKFSDLLSGFLYYDRKEDDELPVGAFEQALESGTITQKDLAIELEQILRSTMENHYKNRPK